MRAASATGLSLILGLGGVCLGAGGCTSKHPAKAEAGAEEGEAEGGSADGRSAASADDRIPAFPGQAVGVAPAYMDGAFVYASAELRLGQELLQSLPMEPSVARDFAQIAKIIGADPRVDDLLGHFGLAEDARVSVSIRPLVGGAAGIRESLETRGPVVLELVGAAERTLENPESPEADPQALEPERGEPLRSKQAEAFLEGVDSLGFHLRAHVQTRSPNRLEPLLSTMREEWEGETLWTQACADARASGKVRLCGGERDGVLVVRDVSDGLQFDLYMAFGSRDEPDTPSRRAILQGALSEPRAKATPALTGLRGDAQLYADGAATVAFLEGVVLHEAVEDLPGGGLESVGDSLEELAAIEQLHIDERVFSGAAIEVSARGGQLSAVARWLPMPGPAGKARLEAFELLENDADVPSVASLCDGSLMCARTRGLPNRQRLSSLATGVYADPEAFGELLDDHDELAALVLLLETWPNAVGTAGWLPGKLVSGPESFVVKNALGVLDRVLGFGVSVRSLKVDRRGVEGDWVGYARMSAADLNTLAGFMAMAEVQLSPAQVPGVPSRVETTPIPDRDVSGSYYAVYDPKADTGEWGWAVLADGDDRLRLLFEGEYDDGAAPLAYAEIPDLWRVVASVSELSEEFAFAQAWLTKRWVRAQLSMGEAGPEFHLAAGKR